MKITPEMLDVEAKKTTIWQTALGSMNVDECLCAYLNALLESGRARTGKDFTCHWRQDIEAPECFEPIPVLIIRLDNADERKRKEQTHDH